MPLGNFGPFIEAALGYGNISGALGYSKGGLEIRVGGGFIYFFTRSLARRADGGLRHHHRHPVPDLDSLRPDDPARVLATASTRTG